MEYRLGLVIVLALVLGGCMKKTQPVETGPAEWEPIALPTPATYRDVVVRQIRGSGPNDIWVLANAHRTDNPGAPYGLSFHFDGKQWNLAEVPARATNTIVPISPTEAWALGVYGTVARWDGKTWTAEKIVGIDWDLIDAAGWHDDIWVAGAGQGLVHFDGQRWTDVRPPELGTMGIHKVFALPNHELLVPRHDKKDDPAIVHYAKGQWRIDPVGPGGIVLLAATGPRDIWAIGAKNHSYHFDGFRWSKFPTSDGYYIGAWATSPTEAYIVGEHGEVLIWDGLAWKRSPSGTRARLWTVFAPPGGKPIIGGDGVLLQKK